MPRLSVVIPAYNEQRRILATLADTYSFLRSSYPDSELVVVNDGSTDATAEMVLGFRARQCKPPVRGRAAGAPLEPVPSIRLLEHGCNLGKGAAVRTGVIQSRGELVLVMDADGATHLADVARLEQAILDGNDLVCASRRHKDSVIVTPQPLVRRLVGRTYSVIVRALQLTSVRDTQCGFKLMRGEVARSLFRRQSLDSYVFEVEVLNLAQQQRLRVAEVGVAWSHRPHSTVRLVRDAATMLVDLVRLRVRLGLGARRSRRLGDFNVRSAQNV